MHYYCYNTLTGIMTNSCEQLLPSIELLMQQAGLYKRGTFTKVKPIKKLLCRKHRKEKECVDIK